MKPPIVDWMNIFGLLVDTPLEEWLKPLAKDVGRQEIEVVVGPLQQSQLAQLPIEVSMETVQLST